MEQAVLHNSTKSDNPQSVTSLDTVMADGINLNGPEGSPGENNVLLKNPEAREAVERGLADVAAGRVHTRRS
jgi:hypothetical protein